MEECKLELLNEKETYYINLFDSFNRDKGYNIKSVGDTSYYFGELTEEHKKHISESCKGIKMPDSQKESTRKRMIQWHTDNNTRKPVRCIETGQEWESVELSEKETGLQVSRCCRGKYLNSGNLHFEFVNISDKNEFKDNLLKTKQRWLLNHKPVLCLNNNKIYKTNVEAEKELGTEHHKINDSCNKNRPCKDGLSYRWLTEEEINVWIENVLI